MQLPALPTIQKKISADILGLMNMKENITQ